MVVAFCSLLHLSALAASADSLASARTPAADTLAVGRPPAADASAADTAAVARRVVREFPAVEVRALLHDARSSRTVREIPTTALRAYPADALADLVALQAGVIAQAEELHVRGGRAGETLVLLDGVSLNEPLRHRPMELPLLALRSVDLVSGASEARHAGALAGVLELHTLGPGDRPAGEWRWQSDGGLDTRYDRVSGRVSAPLRRLGIGLVAAGEALLDDTALPALRTVQRRRIAGLSFGWRAENRMLGYLKLAPLAHPRALTAQVMASRTVRRPFDPAWSLDGWTGFNGAGFPAFSPTPLPGYQRFRAADRKAMTDERRLATVLAATGVHGGRSGTVTLGWLRTRSATTVGGVHAVPETAPGADFDPGFSDDPFHVIGGEDPLYRVSASDVVSLRGDLELVTARGVAVRTGLGASYEDVRLHELDATVQDTLLDAVRAYHATPPGGFLYGQGRWQSGGLVLNGGLRVELYSAGPQAARQTLPGSGQARWSFLPRLGIAYPLSSRDVFSMSYSRVDQTPDRDHLYDRRVRITNRQPLGNPALQPPTMISYEAALKHLFSPAWALQTSFFYRDVAHLAGARDAQTPGGAVDQRYTDQDQASSAGLELSVVHDRGEGRRLEAHYTFMHAWGFESRPEGDPYGPVRDIDAPPIAELPLSWDRRHSLVVSGVWEWRRRLSVAWSSLVGSPLPWTPKTRRVPLADVTQVNSRRLGWSAVTNVGVTWSPPYALGLTFGIEARNLFDDRSERAATVDGYPNPVINTFYDDYGAYRTETGRGGGAYWIASGGGRWVPVNDPRLYHAPRAIRASVGRRW
jgi:outer membrane receptor protein involved in Fe transport